MYVLPANITIKVMHVTSVRNAPVNLHSVLYFMCHMYIREKSGFLQFINQRSAKHERSIFAKQLYT